MKKVGWAALLIAGLLFWLWKHPVATVEKTERIISSAPAVEPVAVATAKTAAPEANFNEAFARSDYCGMLRAVSNYNYLKWAPAYIEHLWQGYPDAPMAVEIHSRAIQEALFQPTFSQKVERLSRERHWRPRFFLALLYAGMLEGQGTASERPEYPKALAILNEIEKEEPSVAFIAFYKAVVLDRIGTSLEEVRAYLKRELPTRGSYESPIDAPFQDLATLATTDPRLMALLPIYSGTLPALNLSMIEFFLKISADDPAMAALILQFGDRWQSRLLSRMGHRLSEHYSPLIEFAIATGTARRFWDIVNPGTRLPERFTHEYLRLRYDEVLENSLPELLKYKYFEDDPTETPQRPCDPAFAKAASNDAQTLRDRIRLMNEGHN